jgi:hypothetical protein
MKAEFRLQDFNEINGNYFYKSKKLKITENSQGYKRFYMYGKAFRIHRVLALKYIPNPENLKVVDHIDANKSNNNLINLQWLSYSQNSKKAYQQNANMKLKKGIVKHIISEKNGIKKEHKSLRNCAAYVQRDVAAVYRVLQGEWNLCNGFKLLYK